MTVKFKQLTPFIFPMLVLFNTFVSIGSATISYIVMNQLINYQDATEQFFLDYYEQSDQSAETKVLGETVTYIQSEKEQQEHLRSRNQNLKSISLEFSPNKSKSAFFQEKVIKDSTNASRDADYVSETVVVLQQGNKTEEIFKGDFHLSNLEWLNDRELVIYRSKYGISVADRGNEYGRRLLEIRRDHPDVGSGLTDQTTVGWSPDSSKLAVVIRKENEEKLELLVY